MNKTFKKTPIKPHDSRDTFIHIFIQRFCFNSSEFSYYKGSKNLLIAMLSQGRPEIENPGKSQFNFFFNFLKFKKS